MLVISGFSKSQRWISGHIPMKQNVVVYVDTRSGEGVSEILLYLKDFIRYQASHISLPSYSTEDVIQELNLIAISAINNYDASKGANMLTFLQNHLKNRIINIYKFATEKCRTATHENFRFCKIKCPKCKQYSTIDEHTTKLENCYNCGHRKLEKETWRSYPIPIAFISANEEFVLQDGSKTTIQDYSSYGDTFILNGIRILEGEDRIVARVTLHSTMHRLDSITQQILTMLLEGHTMIEISKTVHLSTPCIKSKIQALRKNRAFIELFA